MRKIRHGVGWVGLLVLLGTVGCVITKTEDGVGTAGTAAVPMGGMGPISTASGGAVDVNAGGADKGLVCDGLLEQFQTDPKQVCSQSEVRATFNQINVLIVLDKSGSMTSIPEGFTRSKWAGAIEALKRSLDPKDELVSYGILLFPYDPSVSEVSCELAMGQAAVNVPVGPAWQTVPQINELVGATTPSGGTPTAAALGAAFDYYTKGDGARLAGAKYVLLVTDGGPNCNSNIACNVETCTAFMDKLPSMSSCWNGGVPNCCDRAIQVPGRLDPQSLCLDDQATTAQLQALRSAGIPSFVIGIPGTGVYADYLDQFADAGGQPVSAKARKYYEVTGESGLTETLRSITQQLVSSCVVQLVEAPADLTKINVAIDCVALPQRTPERTNWHYDEANQSIVIEGVMCDRIRTIGVKRIDVINNCPIIIIQ